MSAALVAGYSRDTWARAFPAAVRARPVLRVVPALVQHDAGVLERRNPLPVGVYWKDIFEADGPGFSAWIKKSPSVLVRATEHIAGDPPRDWVLFEVKTPAHWDGPGFPDIAAPNVKTSADTVQRPPPEKDPLDKIKLPDSNDPFGLKGLTAGLLAGAAVLAAILLLKK